MSIEKYISKIIEREGSYVNHPEDKGGATKYGITLKIYAAWSGEFVTNDDIENLTVEEAYKIYKQEYLIKPGIHNIIDYKLQALMLDAAINHGASQAIKFLQQVLNIEDDGIIGAVTIQTANNFSSMDILRKKYLGKRIVFYGKIINRDYSQVVFIVGWLNRAADLLVELC